MIKEDNGKDRKSDDKNRKRESCMTKDKEDRIVGKKEKEERRETGEMKMLQIEEKDSENI